MIWNHSDTINSTILYIIHYTYNFTSYTLYITQYTKGYLKSDALATS